MTDREKVIKGFTCCEIDASCANCPYFDSNTCIADLRNDVFELLKKQPEMLKEQESKPVLYRDDGEYCPWCSTVSTRTMGVQRLHRGTRYCPYCGQEVKWE